MLPWVNNLFVTKSVCPYEISMAVPSNKKAHTSDIARRTGARRMSEIPKEISAALNRGEIESASLVEALSVDFFLLMRAAFPELDEKCSDILRGALSLGITKRMTAAGNALFRAFGQEAFDRARPHKSDTVRGWAAYALAADKSLSFGEKLSKISTLADDPHFNVREWAWLALRDDISQDIRAALSFLAPWTEDPSENIRRFAVESTRPRGVWTHHIKELKTDPSLAEPLLIRVIADPSRYVQRSLGNWLNDAAKTCPDWVENFLCSQKKNQNKPAFRYIAARARRNL